MKKKTKRGGYRKTEIGELVKSNPSSAASLVWKMWTTSTGATEAAKKLDISRVHFFRVARKLESLGYDVGRPEKTEKPGIDTGISEIVRTQENRP